MEKLLREFCLKRRMPALWRAPMSDYTSFRIGGAADAFLLPETEKALVELLAFLRDHGIPFDVIGNGTNLLFSDDGFRGAVVSTRHMRGVTVSGNTVRAAAGTPLNVLCRTLFDHSLDGFTSLYGIPGTVGGAVFMNAGAFGGEIADHLTSVSVYCTREDVFKTLFKKDLDFSYRHSVFRKEKDLVILSAEFSFPTGNQEEMREKMRQNIAKRTETQPTSLPCAGSAFLRPPEGSAAMYIEKAGLKGASVGGAAVSQKHAGFIVNLGGATAEDVLSLMTLIQNKVKDTFGITLIPEIEYIG